MKIKYVFANGEVSQIEVNEEMGELLLDFDRLEYNNNQKENRRHTSLDNGFDDAEWLAVTDADIEAIFADESNEKRLHKAILKLKPKQQELIIAIFFKHIKQEDYARQMGITQQAVSSQLNTVMKKLKKLF